MLSRLKTPSVRSGKGSCGIKNRKGFPRVIKRMYLKGVTYIQLISEDKNVDLGVEFIYHTQTEPQVLGGNISQRRFQLRGHPKVLQTTGEVAINPFPLGGAKDPG